MNTNDKIGGFGLQSELAKLKREIDENDSVVSSARDAYASEFSELKKVNGSGEIRNVKYKKPTNRSKRTWLSNAFRRIKTVFGIDNEAG